jgi:hypothetical protein
VERAVEEDHKAEVRKAEEAREDNNQYQEVKQPTNEAANQSKRRIDLAAVLAAVWAAVLAAANRIIGVILFGYHVNEARGHARHGSGESNFFCAAHPLSSFKKSHGQIGSALSFIHSSTDQSFAEPLSGRW